MMMHCALCNEAIDEKDLDLGEARDIDGEYWHTDCYAEYFEEEGILDEV